MLASIPTQYNMTVISISNVTILILLPTLCYTYNTPRTTYNTNNISAWANVTRDVKTPYDLEAHPLQISTDSALGSDEQVMVYFYTSEEAFITYIGLYFTSTPQYKIHYCSSQYTAFPTALPDEQDKVWTITEGDASFTVHCNDVEVVNFLYTDSVWSGSSALCEDQLGMDAEQIKFSSSDTASDAYREQQGGRYIVL